MNELDKFIFLHKYKLGILKQGEVRMEIFDILVTLSKINSEKVICALRDFLVNGVSRKEACLNNSLSLGYFSISLKKLNDTNNCIAGIIHYHRNLIQNEYQNNSEK
ncbi:transcriptional regulator [Salmonella enterica]|nr:transcriptional regulator [Salmonella enterica]ECJ2547521.1 transcriptional regulator [Salmonella enterica subsp. arizonae]EAB4961846.1 transcriptional regulator [Salmonella enterica]EAX5088497.1 transcriptional regulator [Salmonella enterica]EAZ5906828.1 transcriptional regulator [Salmonella enterica]